MFYPLPVPFAHTAPPPVEPYPSGPYPIYPPPPNGPYLSAPGPMLPEGMILEIEPTSTDADRAVPKALARWRDVGTALRACWSPPATGAGNAEARQVTLRLGFNKYGNLMGPPRITYASPPQTTDAQKSFTASVLAALKRCAPLPFTPGLGSAIAGVPFAIRFVDPFASEKAR